MMNGSSMPAFTVLDENFETSVPTQPQRPLWESQYAANILSAPPNTPFSDFDVPNNFNVNYDSLSVPSGVPKVSSSYEEMLRNNRSSAEKLKYWGLEGAYPAPAPGELNLPQYVPPYGTAYPTNGYSAFDGAMAMDSNIPSFYALGGVPYASHPALEDARNSPSVAAGPNHLFQFAETHFKEGYKSASEDYLKNYTATCKDSIDHINSCSICRGYLHSDKKMLWLGIVIMGIIIVILLWLFIRKNKAESSGRTGSGESGTK